MTHTGPGALVMKKVTPESKRIEALEERYGKFITIGARRYRRFVIMSAPILDGTRRCKRCGQIDEPEYHIRHLCTR